ncbi:hypothetical protein D9619_013733 [Psilocybe cf. subviscida]|uniref:Uncharacterized protein n=1 Tax=Psilocybe cf. subviscida TaxID=2480587 RepID=A0A8H5BHJ8_9AGAR|nr:hypothetical protein D9619_013733 [Psilocybe cf. subviscida]
MHNSGERFDAPTCHEETRIALQEDLLGWADELVNDLNNLVTWLYGPAGSGKSAIAQTVAQKLHARGSLPHRFSSLERVVARAEAQRRISLQPLRTSSLRPTLLPNHTFPRPFERTHWYSICLCKNRLIASLSHRLLRSPDRHLDLSDPKLSLWTD